MHRGVSVACYEIVELESVHRTSHDIANVRSIQCLQTFSHLWRGKPTVSLACQ